MKLSRREVALQGLAFALLAGCKIRDGGSSGVLAGEADPALGRGKRVIVLGGGIAGLTAAYKLQAQGFSVTVLEKTNRISGRVWTNRGYFCDNQYCEFGATRIPDIHDKTLAYAKMLGLEVMPASFGDDNRLYCVNGKRFTKRDTEVEANGLATYLDAEGAYTKQLFAAIGPDASEERVWQEIQKQGLDSQTFGAWLKSACGFTDDQVRLVAASNGSEIHMFSASMWMAAEYLERNWDQVFRIKGGNDQIASGLASRLDSPVTLLANVQAVRATREGVSVDFVEKGTKKTLDGDFVISTLPLDVIKKVQWLPGLSKAKMEASQSVRMQSVTRVNLQFAKRFWETDEGLKGLKVLHSDFEIERFWDMTVSTDQKQPLIPKAGKSLGDVEETGPSCGVAGEVTEKGILTSYIQSDNAVKMGKLSPADRIAAVMKDLKRAFPKVDAESLFVKGNSWVWHQQSWTGGGWAAYAPNQLDLYFATRISEADGKILFAGDHTTIEAGWIQGAIQSGERAAEELVQSVQSQVPKSA